MITDSVTSRPPRAAADIVATRARFLAAPTWKPGAASREELTTLTDNWLRAVAAEADLPGSGVALVAVGGYGRRELAPGSDLDLLLLHSPGLDVGVLADKIWYPVWDAGIRLDHSVRTVPEARRLASSDLRVVLGLIDARTVAGDDSLTSALRSSVLGDWRSLARDRLPQLRAAGEARAERSGELASLLEPDLKESYGGIRDIVVLRAVAATWIADIPHGLLETPHQQLLDTRDALHHVAGRATDRLTQEEQSAVARQLGLADADEVLRTVASAGRAVAYASDVTWSRVERVARRRTGVRRLEGRKGAPGRVPLAEGVVVQDGEVVLALEARPDRDPVLLLRAAAAAAQAGLPLAPHTVARLAQECAPLPEPWPREARDALVSLLGAGRPTMRVWEALDQVELWGRLIPEWEVVRCAPQRNAMHTYTVDRHLVETAVQASALTRRVRRPDLLLVGALLHDVGKARGGDHTDIGIELVGRIAPRMGFDEADSAVLVDLVRHHLLLPDVATRRDLDDPDTVAAVATLVPDPDTLDLLGALTQADSLATGPAVWSEWKARLVDSLVAKARAATAGEEEIDVPVFTASERAWAMGDGVDLQLQTDGPEARVTIASPDRVGLLATTAGVLALHRLGVRSAQTETIGDRVIATWSVQPTFGDVPPVERLREDLRRALDGTLDVAEALARRDRDSVRDVAAPTVEVIPGASSRATVLEVRAHDASGLLHRVPRWSMCSIFGPLPDSL